MFRKIQNNSFTSIYKSFGRSQSQRRSITLFQICKKDGRIIETGSNRRLRELQKKHSPQGRKWSSQAMIEDILEAELPSQINKREAAAFLKNAGIVYLYEWNNLYLSSKKHFPPEIRKILDSVQLEDDEII